MGCPDSSAEIKLVPVAYFFPGRIGGLQREYSVAKRPCSGSGANFEAAPLGSNPRPFDRHSRALTTVLPGGERWPSGLGRRPDVRWFESHFGKNFSLRNFGNSVYPALPVSFG